MTALSEALRELLKYPFDTRGKWFPVWANARKALADHDAQQKSTNVQDGCLECADPWKTPCRPGHCAAKERKE
jgi:hypothetical protein